MSREPGLTTDLVRQFRSSLPTTLKIGDADKVGKDLDVLADLDTAFARRMGEIDLDGRLTPAGQNEARQKAAKETLAKLKAWHEPKVRGLEKHETALLGELANVVSVLPASDPGARMEQAHLRSEIRRAAQGMDKQQREILYRMGDALTRQALNEIPCITTKGVAVISEPFVAKEIQQEVLLDAACEKMPEASDQLDDIANLKEIYGTLAATLRREIESAVPGALEHPVSVI